MPPLFKTLIVLAAILLVMMTTIYVAQDYIVYGTLFSWDSANVTPADYGITKFESVRLKSVDGTLIKSFWLPTDKSEASKVPTIIMYHVRHPLAPHLTLPHPSRELRQTCTITSPRPRGFWRLRILIF